MKKIKLIHNIDGKFFPVVRSTELSVKQKSSSVYFELYNF